MTVQASMDDLLRKLQAGDQLAFEQLANALVSRDNSERKTAESFYEQLVEHHPDVAVRYLGAGLSSSASDMKHFCCLYLRKVRAASSYARRSGPPAPHGPQALRGWA